MNSPTTFRAGDSASWSESLSAYPASAGWIMKLRMLWPAGQAIDIATTADGDDFAVTLAASDTASWQAGKATLVAWVEKGTQSITVGDLSVQVLPNLRLQANHDGRTANKRALDAAEAALLKYLEGGQALVEEYEIDGRRMKFRSTQEIRDLIAHYKRAVAKENAAFAILQGGGMPGRVHYRAGKG
jgi:hypothetical protein